MTLLRSKRRPFLLLFSFSILSPVFGNVTLPAIFSDHAVLQKSADVPVWGKAAPGEHVLVVLDGARAETVSDTDGKWRISLDLHGKGPGPFELVVTGQNRLLVSDVVIGEVWLCSGQSNMEWILTNTIGADAEIARSADTQLRQFLVKKKASSDPLDDCEGRWVVAGPQTSGGFTAVGYYFGKALHKRLNQPVGLIHSSWGGTNIERWISTEGFKPDAELNLAKDNYVALSRNFDTAFAEYGKNYSSWIATYGRQDRSQANPLDFAAPSVSTKEWKPVRLPGLLAQAGLPDAGVVWVRRLVSMPREQAGTGLILELGCIHDFDTVYWNGHKIAETIPAAPGSVDARSYWLPGEFIVPGENTLAVRIFSPAGGAGLSIDKGPLKAGGIELAGEWMAKPEQSFAALGAEARRAYVRQPAIAAAGPDTTLPRFLAGSDAVPTGLFNGMINPIVPYAFQGAIWYQGEANASRAAQYQTAMPLMIQDWRRHWGRGDFPFYICQLANFGPKKDLPVESSWAELREAQARALSLPKTGLAVLIDIGDEADIHPRHKKEVGERLALIARAQVYGDDIPYSGPMYQAMTLADGKIRLNFTHAEGGLIARPLPKTYQLRSVSPDTAPLVQYSPGSELQGFAICGADRNWRWAKAKIDHDAVVVWSTDVPQPVAVRYAWADNPTCNLYNGAGLPAVPFRTDDFALSTQGHRF